MGRHRFISAIKLKRNVDFVLNTKYHRVDKKVALGALYGIYLQLGSGGAMLLDKSLADDFARQLRVPKKAITMTSQNMQNTVSEVRKYEHGQCIIHTNSKIAPHIVRAKLRHHATNSSTTHKNKGKWNSAESKKLQENIKALKTLRENDENQFDRFAMK